MNRKETSLLVESWRNLTNEDFYARNEDFYARNEVYFENKKQLEELVKWGDQVESYLNENLDFVLLESYFINEGLWSSFVKAKDQVKNYLSQGFTKNKSDVKNDENEILMIKRHRKEYTSLTKAIGLLMLVSSLANVAGLSNKKNLVDKINEDLPIPITVVYQDLKNAENAMESNSIPKEIKVSPKEFEKIKKIVSRAGKNKVKNNKSELNKLPGLNKPVSISKIIEKLNQEKGAELNKLTAHGIDTSGEEGHFNETNIEVKNDMAEANKEIKKVVAREGTYKFDNVDLTLPKGDYDMRKANNTFRSLSSEEKTGLIRVAKLKTLKKLYQESPDLFKNNKLYKDTRSYESRDDKKSDSDSSQKVSGTVNSKILYVLYDFDVSLDSETLNANLVVSELESLFKNYNVTYGSSLAIMTFKKFLYSSLFTMSSKDLKLAIKKTRISKYNFKSNANSRIMRKIKEDKSLTGFKR